MANFITRALGFVDVVQEGASITIGGVRAESLGRDILRVWGTNRIERNMFSEIGGRVIRFPLFFAPEVYYILSKLLEIKNIQTSRGSIKEALKLLDENTWLKRTREEFPSIIDESKINEFHKKPLPHQVNFMKAYSHRVQAYGLNGYLLSAGPGTGKTLTSLMLAEMLGVDYVIIVSPKNAVYRVWDNTLEKEYIKSREHWVVADNVAYSGQKYLVSHYEGLTKLSQATPRLNGRIAVILDESHNLNGDESLRTQTFIDICKHVKAQHVLWMSGTPVKALGIESIPLLRTIDPLFTPDVEMRFRKMYGRDATKALDILRHRMGMISFHVESGAVVTNETKSNTKNVKIPNAKAYTLDTVRTEMQQFIEKRLNHYASERRSYEKIYDKALDIYEDTIKDKEEKAKFKMYKRYVEMISEGFDPKNMAAEAKYCNHFEKNIIAPVLPAELKKQFMSAKSVIKYPQLKVLGEALGTVLSQKRVQCHIDMIPYMGLPEIIRNASKKTVIFSSYVQVVNAIAKYLTTEGFDPVVVHAQLGQDLTSQVALFEKKPEANPLVATFQSLSTAVPLTMANCTVFTNMPFREYEITQAQARTNRLGQDTAVSYWNIYLDTGKEPNVSTRSRDILEWSRQQVASILGQDYAGTITADMVNALESFTDEVLPEHACQPIMNIGMEDFCDLYE